MDELRRASQTNTPGPAEVGVSTNRTASPLRTPKSRPHRADSRGGLNRSQVMETLSYLTDVIGPRLTGSPNLKHANEWTRDKLTAWGLTNAMLEA